jgi:hypothetical protein
MIRLSIAGQAVELNERPLLTLIDNIAASYPTQGELYHRNHARGFADWHNVFPRTLEMVGWDTPMETVEARIDDDELRQAFHSFREHLKRLVEIDEQIVEWLAGFVGLSFSEDERDRRRLGRRLDKILEDQGAIWAMQPEYRVFVGRSQKHMLAVTEAKQRMDRRLKQLTGRCDEDGDALTGGKSST